jgi:hypothetical protein
VLHNVHATPTNPASPEENPAQLPHGPDLSFTFKAHIRPLPCFSPMTPSRLPERACKQSAPLCPTRSLAGQTFPLVPPGEPQSSLRNPANRVGRF